ncbi:family 20 glycosylhydrolase [Algoriphagus sediminis]|uniref:beta-N-acetylhexosaminidase n=1 Tax=Algoriphagus sediminis TaxID=3057113 RepID=A0ABT7Y8H1_9BACT|nr:family 20 glycosylhydrolase [Algoriphagus sediminis]MDN3202818.1 family 20 glycosylhydrolase [Algoriphagus sediminis]
MQRFFIFLTLVLMVFSCQSSGGNNLELQILPSPTSLSISGISGLDLAEVRKAYQESYSHFVSEGSFDSWNQGIISFTSSLEKSLKKEAYKLEISEERIEIIADSPEGHWYGLMTLGQILEDSQDQLTQLPLLKISDEPALSYRAIHWDVKHHLEKKEYYYEKLDQLAAQKINAVIVEIEDKLAYELQPKVGSPDAFSIADWKEISDYAKARNIELSPLVQGLGHASFILKHEEYVHLRDDPSSDWAFNPLNEKTYEIQFDLYKDALKAFPYASYLHVGGDEVHTTGRNSGKSALELQLIWLNRVSEYAAQKGLIPIFWDDMPLKNAGVYNSIYNRNLTEAQVDSIWTSNEPELNKYVDMFPKNCVYMRWNYSIPESPGNERAMKWFLDNGFKVMGATAGQTRWNLMPQQQSNAKNIRDFALISIRNKAEGLLLTLWDDDSPHFELYGRGISNFAEYTWAGEKRTIEGVQKAFRQRTFGHTLADESYEFIDSLELAVGFWKNSLLKEGADRNRLTKLGNEAINSIIELPNLDSAGAWSEKNENRLATARKNLARIDVVLSKIEASKDRARRNHYTLEVYEQVAEVVQFSNRTLLTLAEFDEPSGESRNQAEAKLEALESEWKAIQSKVESVYGKTRQLNKPADYILDQDHHVHLANQALKFSDWQFKVEKLLVEKVKNR